MSDKPTPSPFHKGEQAMQERAGMREHMASIGGRLIRNTMPEQHRDFFAALPMVLLGSIADDGQPWASVLTSASGLITTPDATRLDIHALPRPDDPLHANLKLGAPIGMLGIEPATRRRNRMNGVVTHIDDQGFALQVVQSFGNCPKYIQARSPGEITQTMPPVVHRSDRLDDHMVRMLNAADTYFIASAFIDADAAPAAQCSVDMSHRGGKPGFIRVDDANTLSVPDFIGNYFFNTLGNISEHPATGLLVMDFHNGDVLHLAVDAHIIWEPNQIKLFDGALRLMRYHIKQAVRIEGAVPLRWSEPQQSPVLAATGSWAAADKKAD